MPSYVFTFTFPTIYKVKILHWVFMRWFITWSHVNNAKRQINFVEDTMNGTKTNNGQERINADQFNL